MSCFVRELTTIAGEAGGVISSDRVGALGVKAGAGVINDHCIGAGFRQGLSTVRSYKYRYHQN